MAYKYCVGHGIRICFKSNKSLKLQSFVYSVSIYLTRLCNNLLKKMYLCSYYSTKLIFDYCYWNFHIYWFFLRMQVEVSKHTEGSKDTMLRPNGLPESLIRYDGMIHRNLMLLSNWVYSFPFNSCKIFCYFFFPERQKDKARSSLSELMVAVKQPRSISLSDSVNLPFRRRSEGSGEFSTGRRNSETGPPSRRNSGGGVRSSLQKISEVPEKVVKKPRKSGMLSFMGYFLEI